MTLTKFIFVFLVAAFCFTACKKKENYVCDCTYYTATDTLTDSYEIGEKSSMADAEADCNAHKSELLSNGAVSADCKTSAK